MNVKETIENREEITRRFFLGWGSATIIGMASLAASLLTMLRMPIPSLMPGKAARFKIGNKEDFPPGTTKYFEMEQVYVFADQKGISAMSAICTHLGCIVSKEQKQFVCPCHGSRYDLTGRVMQGPAPKNLSWYSVAMLPSAKLVVDRNKVVQPGTKLLV